MQILKRCYRSVENNADNGSLAWGVSEGSFRGTVHVMFWIKVHGSETLALLLTVWDWRNSCAY